MKTEKSSTIRRLAAWGVHLLTGMGAVFGLLAVLSIMEQRWIDAFKWLAVALIVDGIDGPLARFVDVRRVLPRINGELLDLLVDYFNFVIVPALFLARSELLEEPFRVPVAAIVLVTSQYHYVRSDLKTVDSYFQGFPAFWNIVVFYLYVLNFGHVVNSWIVCVLSALTLTSTKWVHPIRVKELSFFTFPVTAVTCISSAVVLISLPSRPTWAIALSLLGLLYFCVLGVIRTIRGTTSGNN